MPLNCPLSREAILFIRPLFSLQKGWSLKNHLKTSVFYLLVFHKYIFLILNSDWSIAMVLYDMPIVPANILLFFESRGLFAYNFHDCRNI
jgi:hypothetical protein